MLQPWKPIASGYTIIPGKIHTMQHTITAKLENIRRT